MTTEEQHYAAIEEGREARREALLKACRALANALEHAIQEVRDRAYVPPPHWVKALAEGRKAIADTKGK